MPNYTAIGTHQVGHLFIYLLHVLSHCFQVFHLPVSLKEVKIMNCAIAQQGLKIFHDLKYRLPDIVFPKCQLISALAVL